MAVDGDSQADRGICARATQMAASATPRAGATPRAMIGVAADIVLAVDDMHPQAAKALTRAALGNELVPHSHIANQNF